MKLTSDCLVTTFCTCTAFKTDLHGPNFPNRPIKRLGLNEDIQSSQRTQGVP